MRPSPEEKRHIGGVYDDRAIERRFLRFDPRAKLLVLVLINVVAFASSDLVLERLCVGAIAVLLTLMGAYRQAATGLITYAVVTAALYLCGLLPGFLSGYFAMMVICIRKILPMMMFGSGLIATTKVGELVCALQKARFPKCIVIPFAVTLRFFPTAREEFACIRDAMKLRGIGPNAGNLLTRPLAVAECVFVPMMLRSATIAEELSAAAATRGIDSAGRRTSVSEIGFHLPDFIAVGAFTVLALLGTGVLGD